MTDFADRLLTAPIGVGLLEFVESHDVGALSVDELLGLAVEAARDVAGPWNPSAPERLAAAYRSAEGRRGVAEAIAAKFAEPLRSNIDFAAQEWWVTDPAPHLRLFTGSEKVYSAGEFTWDGLRTVSSPPATTHRQLVWAWDMYEGVSRWRLPITPGAHVFEVHDPDDWVELVERYPAPARRLHSGWELPGLNQPTDDLNNLITVPGQRAARTSLPRHLVPNWPAVAEDYDGVHLSWAGYITAEGYISDLADGGVTMLRYWSSERTLWLNPVFGEPEPLGAPAPDRQGFGVDVRADAVRRAKDLAAIEHMLGRT